MRRRLAVGEPSRLTECFAATDEDANSSMASVAGIMGETDKNSSLAKMWTRLMDQNELLCVVDTWHLIVEYLLPWTFAIIALPHRTDRRVNDFDQRRVQVEE